MVITIDGASAAQMKTSGVLDCCNMGSGVAEEWLQLYDVQALQQRKHESMECQERWPLSLQGQD